MLIRFVVSNFMSFKNETEFNMLPSKGKGYKKHPNHLIPISSGIDVLKTAAIYGANASGKSNLVKAIEYLKELIQGSNEGIIMPQSKRFRIEDSFKSKSTTFRIEYEFRNIHFDYGLEIDKGKIKEEWLYRINSVKKQKDELLFIRKDNLVTFGDHFKDIDTSYVEKYLEKELRATQCALNGIYNNIDDDELVDTFYEGIERLAIISPHSFNSEYAFSIILKEKSKSYVENILRKSNTGIEELVVEDISVDKFFSYEEEDTKLDFIDKLEAEIDMETETETETETEKLGIFFYNRNQYNLFKKVDDKYFVSVIKTKHFGSDNLFDLIEESDGTNRLFELAPAFEYLTGDEDLVYILDELERSMHPTLAKELLKIFVDNSTSKSQLIFTTHESHLLDLDLLRQDEIWFTEKKLDGSSTFYPLSDFNPREDKNIRLGYLEGRYGGIPFLGDFSKLN